MRIGGNSSWHSAVSVAGVAVLALATVANAAPRVIQDASKRLQRVETTETPQVRYSIQAQALGRASSASGDAFVYKYAGFSGYGLFSNMQPLTGAYGGLGSFISSPFQFGNGFDPATDKINGYRLLLFRSSLDPGAISGSLATIHTELWDGDPFSLLGTAGGGYANAKIAGTDGDWDGVPAPSLGMFVAAFPPVSVPHQDVFLVLTSNACNMGYLIDSQHAPIGEAALPYGDLFLIQSDYDGQFAETGSVCCGDTDGSGPRDCNINTAPCTNNYLPVPSQCSDGHAERAEILNFGGPCTGGVADFCSSFVVDIFAPANFNVSLVPIDADVPHTITGNLITMDAGGGHVWMNLMFEGWGYDGQSVKTWQARINPSGYHSGSAGFLTPWNPPCTSDVDCNAALNHTIGYGSCNDTYYPPGGCSPGYQDWAQYGDVLNIGSGAVNIHALAFIYGSTGLGLPVADPGGAHYAGTFVLEVSDDAAGLFTIQYDPAGTWMRDPSNQRIPLIGLTHGEIEVVTGKCCNSTFSGIVCIADGITADQCSALGSGTVFWPGENCTDNPECSCNSDDAHCDDGDACTTDTCVDGTCSNDDNFDSTVDCCLISTSTLDPIDDGNECTADSCSGANGRGVAVHDAAAVDGNTCYDGEPCTTVNNVCLYGDCIGDNIFDIPCTSDALCLSLTSDLGSCSLATGFCRCVPPSLNLGTEDICHAPGDKVSVTVDFADVPATVAGGQFTVYYDPACIDFLSAAGADPFTTLLALEVDEAAGSIYMAVGVDPLVGGGVLGHATLADLSFAKIDTGCDVCNLAFGGINPQDTVLSDDAGNVVADLKLKISDDIRNDASLELTTPNSVSVNRDCDFPSSVVHWDAPTASSDCCDAGLDCWGIYPDGSPIPQDVVISGGELPTGTSNFGCTAWEDCCDGWDSQDWSVVVSDTNEVDVTVQLEPTIVAADLERCIELGFYADCSSSPLIFSVKMNFGGMFDWLGHHTEVIKLPVDGNIICVTAQDKLHSLRATADTSCADGIYSATFKGDPDYFGGNWLSGGNLDAWKAGGSADVIDITDFAQLIAMYGATGLDPATPCGTAGPHADINGDGNVDELDFAYIQRNYGKSSKDSCCPDGVAGIDTTVRTSITNRELRALGMGDLTVADLDHNGQVDLKDVMLFQTGGRRGCKVGGRGPKRPSK